MKNRIIQGFIEETRLNGIKFTMDDLAKRLGISKRTLYENFSSKLEILETIIDMTFSGHEEEARLIREDKSLTLAEKIQQVILIIPKHNEFYDLRILEQLKRYYPEQWQRVDRELNRWEDLEDLLREGMEAGIVKEQNMDLLMKMILSAINITLDQKFFNDQSISMQEGVEAMSDVLLYGLIKEK
ncbi:MULTISPECIES: TetR/AcrR family transcriptional regulator [Planomicrobium]|uniref:TetR/AcrR family transcriptional regulator n=1 Tax=Planomicrobium TaxID=162291 RepID=UPI000C7A59A0|nr:MULTISPECIES: TetR/AcrR family transcriptional regulator [Planomicrobium]PKH12123.1 TetR family transcriptional regulator [Planomicrobium sp. MB-3u-38]